MGKPLNKLPVGLVRAVQLWLEAKQWQAKKKLFTHHKHEEMCNKEKEAKAVKALKACPDLFIVMDDNRHAGMVAVYLNVAFIIQSGMKLRLNELEQKNLHIRRTQAEQWV